MARVIKIIPNTPRQATRIHSVVDNNGSDVGPKLESWERKRKKSLKARKSTRALLIYYCKEHTTNGWFPELFPRKVGTMKNDGPS